VRRYAKEKAEMLDVIADLDLHHCLAQFASAFDGVRPAVAKGGAIEIKGAVNPFIRLSKGERAVPIDILIGEEKQAIIISGPNADGKTVALKTTGLLLAMSSAGMFIPAKATPRVCLFPGIYAVMGDEQDISMELSTFTAHVEAIKSVYEHALGGELVLIDEIGGGTEPQEASALAMGIIDAFVEKGCKVMVTTHLNLLKAYGATHSFALNAATDFDSRTMKPLYRLVYGAAGVSNALQVAQMSGMPQEIIDKSAHYLGKQEYVLNDLVRGLETETKAAQEEKRKAAAYREEMHKRLETIRAKRDEYIARAEERCREKVAALEAQIDEITKEMAKKDREALRAAREKAAALRSTVIPEKKAVHHQGEIHAGDYVRVRTIGKEGYVAQIDGQKGMAEIVIGNMRMRIKKDYVDLISRQTEHKQAPVEVNVSEIEIPEINVRGLRVDEALSEVDRFVDRAIVHGMQSVRILHGIGTGRLMRAIREHLSEAGHIKDIKKDEKNSGITIVELL
jgi:DNA mismatch repair protein MutS2